MAESTSCCRTFQEMRMVHLIRDLKKELDYQKKLQVQLEKEFQEAIAMAEHIFNLRIEHENIKK